MMSDAQYNEYLEVLSKDILENNMMITERDHLIDQIVSKVTRKDNTVIEAILYWKHKLTESEINKVRSYGDAFLSKIDKELRYTTTALIWDINYHQRLRYLEKSLEKYSIEQSLFVSNKELLLCSLNKELIPSTKFQRESFGNIVKFANGKYAFIDNSLEPPLLEKLEERGSIYFVRINPFYYYDTLPPKLMKEAEWRKPSPKWKNAIGIKPNCRDGFSYYIPDDIDIHTNADEYFDRNVNGIFRLEGEYKRQQNGYFSMMVEELKEVKHPFLDEYYVIGRMLHLDSNENGEKGLNTKLKHIDLAINLYTGDNAPRRINERLENGNRIIDASLRSHILRVNDTQLSDIILLSTFFESKTLQHEWIKEMFNLEEKK